MYIVTYKDQDKEIVTKNIPVDSLGQIERYIEDIIGEYHYTIISIIIT